MLFFVKLLIPAITGVVAGSLVMFGVVYSQTQAPDTNPATKQIITYGNTT